MLGNQSLSYYASHDDILYNDNTFIIRDSQQQIIANLGNIASIVGNNITFTEAMKTQLDIGEQFTVEMEVKTRGGLLETKHVLVEVQPWEMTFYNNYYPFSAGSIVAPLYYNLSANYQYQMALNYRLIEKTALTIEHELNGVDENGDVAVDLTGNLPLLLEGEESVVFAYYYNSNNERVYIADEDLSYSEPVLKVHIYDIDAHPRYDNIDNVETLFIEVGAEYHSKYMYYHDADVNLGSGEIVMRNWDMKEDTSNTLFADITAPYFLQDIDPSQDTNLGAINQIYAILNETNELRYYLSDALSDPDGWGSYDTLILNLGFYNAEVLEDLLVEFYYMSGETSTKIADTKITVDMLEGDKGSVYLDLPTSNDWNLFTQANNAYMVIKPEFYDHADFMAYYYQEGVPTYQTIEWNEENVENDHLTVDLEQLIFENIAFAQQILVFDSNLERIDITPIIKTRTEVTIENGFEQEYEVQYILLPNSYLDANQNLNVLRTGDLLFLKYNATVEKTIGLTVGEMVLQRAAYIENYKKGEVGEPDLVPLAEIALLGIRNDGTSYTLDDDLIDHRTQMVAWEDTLDLTPFEDEYFDTYQQKVFNITFDDINSAFKMLDSESVENCYITDILITSNDPRYHIVVDSFFIFEFDENATLYDSEIFDIFAHNNRETLYYGDFEDIYNETLIFDSTGNLPLYCDDALIDESDYFDAFDSLDNNYYFGEHLIATETSQGIYEITWNPDYNEQYYLWYQDPTTDPSELEELYEYYIPHIKENRYLTIAWADENAWNEWRTIDQPNVNESTLEVTFEWFDEITEEYDSVTYDSSLTEFEVRHVAMETIYPYSTASNVGEFDLSQDYTDALNFQIFSITGYYFDDSEYEFNLGSCYLLTGEESIHLEAEMGIKLQDFERIVLLFTFTSGVQSDYTQFRLLQNAIDNYPTIPEWTANDTIYVDFEYRDLDYFILFEDYEVGSDDSMFEYVAYTRNADFMITFEDSFVFSLGNQALDVEAYSEVNDPRVMLEMRDYDLNGEHEYVLEKHDITGDGLYDTFKYGFVNPAGEITFHTTIFDVIASQSYSNRDSTTKQTKDYAIDWKNNEKLNAMAQLTTTTDSVVTQITDVRTTIIQTDTDFDGDMDVEMSFETIYNTVDIQSYITKDYDISIYDASNKLVAQEDFVEYSLSAYNFSDMQSSFMFREFEAGQVISTRYYEDLFPNELADITAITNFERTIINPTTGISIQAPDTASLLDFAQNDDNVPAIFDSITTINSPPESYNILTTSKLISLEEYSSAISALSDNAQIENVEVEIIEVTPSEGVYYDINDGYTPDVLEGGTYYYIDSDSDSIFDTILIADEDGEIIATGFDFDGDGYFVPNKRSLVEVHASSNMADLENKEYFKEAIDAGIETTFIRLTDSDGYQLQVTFSDSLFDLWKTDMSERTSRLINEIRTKTSNEFIETITPMKLFEDLLWQVVSQTAAIVAGYTLGIALSWLGPVGTFLGFMGGYFITYAILNIARSIEQAEQTENFIASQTSDVDVVHLNSKWSNDEVFSGMANMVLFGSTGGVYTEVQYESDEYQYSGQMVLAAGAISKASFNIFEWDQDYYDLSMDYPLQTHNYLGFSDFNEPILHYFLKRTGYVSDHAIEYNHRENSLLWLEEQVKDAASEMGDSLNKVYPYMYYGVPLMLFGDEMSTVAYPEFQENTPIYVSAGRYEEVQNEVNHIFKIGDEYSFSSVKVLDEYIPSVELQVFPDTPANYYDFDIYEIDVYLLWDMGIEYALLGTIPSDDITFDPMKGTITVISPTLQSFKNAYLAKVQQMQNKEVKLCFRISFEKYRSMDESNEQDKMTALMQATEASTLKYVYQYELAKDTQQKLSEIAYTSWVTAISTIITTIISAGIGSVMGPLLREAAARNIGSAFGKGLSTLDMMVSKSASFNVFSLFGSVVKEIGEEVFTDPLVEAITTSVVRQLGGNQYAEIIWSILAESFRETVFGVVTSLFNPKGLRASSQMFEQFLQESNYGNLGMAEQQSKLMEYKQYLEEAEQSQYNSKLQQYIIQGADFTLSVLKLFSFALGGTPIMNLFALGGATLGLKGLDKTWTYAAKRLQTKPHVETSQLVSTWQKVVNSLKENRKMIITSVIVAALSFTLTPLLATINPMLAVGTQLAFATIGMVNGRNDGDLREIDIKITKIQESKSYKTLNLINNLLDELQKQPEAMTRLFPERVKGFSDRQLGVFWGYSESFVHNIKSRISSGEYNLDDYRFKDNKLSALCELAIEKLGVRSLGILRIIAQYKKTNMDALSFIEQIKRELGRVSGDIKVTYKELSLLFGKAEGFISELVASLEDPENNNYKSEYMFSKEILDSLKENLRLERYSLRHVLDLLLIFESVNLYIPEYSHQQYTIENNDAFSRKMSPQIAYWFGFLCADGYLGGKDYTIQFSQKVQDEESVIKFAEFIGLDRISFNIPAFRKDANGEIHVYYKTMVQFVSKLMHKQLQELGLFGSKSERKGVPNFVREAVNLAKEDAANLNVHWSQTYYGKIAHAWLLGYYDGDGNYRGGYSARVKASSKDLLLEMKELFEIRNEVRTINEKGDSFVVYGKETISLGYYALTLGVDVFRHMLSSYIYSMKRKRP